MANLTPIQLTSDGTANVTPVAAAGGGDTVINVVAASPTAATSKQGTVLVIVNGGGLPINVTLTEASVCNHNHALTNLVIAVAAGKTQHIPIPGYLINASGQCAVAYSAVTSVTVYAYNH